MSEKEVCRRTWPGVPGVPLSPERQPKVNKIKINKRKINKRKTIFMSLKYCAGKFQKNSEEGGLQEGKFQNNSEKGDLEEGNFEKR